MIYLNEYKENNIIDGTYFCKNKAKLLTKAGKEYISLQLFDKTGTIEAKIWDLTEDNSNFTNNTFVYVSGLITSYMNSLQATLNVCKPSNNYILDNFMPEPKYDIEDDFSKLQDMINSVSNEYLHKLLSVFFIESENTIKRFKSHSAAKTVHHDYVGGLLHHSVSVAQSCDLLSKQYPLVNREELITSALLHDIGKLRELAPFPVNDYTDLGQFLGHISYGCIMIEKAISTIPEFPDDLKLRILHNILSHHGELEYGSPKKPMTMEAIILSMADDLDAKLESFEKTISGSTEKFIYNKFFGTSCYNSLL